MNIKIVSNGKLFQRCVNITNEQYKMMYGVTIGDVASIDRKVEPVFDRYAVLFMDNDMVGLCGVYEDVEKIYRFDVDNVQTRTVELTKLIIMESFREMNMGSMLTMMLMCYYLSKGYDLLFHSGDDFIKNVLDKVKIRYSKRSYKSSNGIYRVYPHDTLYVSRVTSHISRL